MKGLWGASWRSYYWCAFYNYWNKDPRRDPHWSVGTFASFCAGFAAEFLFNPCDIVYNRQVADLLYPKGMNRNYSSFLHGLTNFHPEDAIFKGAVACGMTGGVALCPMSYFYDCLKELIYFCIGPTQWLRPLVLVPTAFLVTC